MGRRPRISTCTDTLFTYTTLFRFGRTGRWAGRLPRPPHARARAAVRQLGAVGRRAAGTGVRARGGDHQLAAGAGVHRAVGYRRVAGLRRRAVLAAAGELDQRRPADPVLPGSRARSEEHTSELQSLMRNSYAVFCL